MTPKFIRRLKKKYPKELLHTNEQIKIIFNNPILKEKYFPNSKNLLSAIKAQKLSDKLTSSKHLLRRKLYDAYNALFVNSLPKIKNGYIKKDTNEIHCQQCHSTNLEIEHLDDGVGFVGYGYVCNKCGAKITYYTNSEE